VIMFLSYEPFGECYVEAFGLPWAGLPRTPHLFSALSRRSSQSCNPKIAARTTSGNNYGLQESATKKAVPAAPHGERARPEFIVCRKNRGG
jgi:hypothetical protein